MKKIFFIITVTLILSTSCINNELMPRKSFKLDIGFKENDVGLFFNNETLSQDNINIFYRSGFYYISDPKNKKILKITENGFDVLIIYNPDYNPHFKQTNSVSYDQEKNEKEEIVYVKNYKEYPLSLPGMLTVDIEKNIYVIDSPTELTKTENGFVQKSAIIKFDNKGNFLYSLGGEGSTVKPFGYIMKMATDDNNNLIVLEQNSESTYTVNKFSDKGVLLKSFKIENSSSPLNPKEKESGYKADIINIIPSFKENELFITIQYIKEGEAMTLKNFETLYEKIFIYSLKKEKFSKQILKINPKTLNISKMDKKINAGDFFGDKTVITKPMEYLFGADDRDYMYLSQAELPSGDAKNFKKRFMIYDGSGRLKKEFLIKFPYNIQYTSDFYVSPEGKAYYFFVENGVVQIASFNY